MHFSSIRLSVYETTIVKRVPSDWNKTIIDFHYGDDNKKQGNKNKSKVPKQKKRKRKEKKRKVRYRDNK